MGTKEESIRQRKIFGENLSRLVESKYPKQQKDIAKELGEYPTTFNTWCMGKSMPSMGKVQKIADYFGVGKTALLDELDLSSPELDADLILMDVTIKEYALKLYHLPESKQKLAMALIDQLSDKEET